MLPRRLGSDSMESERSRTKSLASWTSGALWGPPALTDTAEIPRPPVPKFKHLLPSNPVVLEAVLEVEIAEKGC